VLHYSTVEDICYFRLILYVFDIFDKEEWNICEYLTEKLNKADNYLSIIEVFIQKFFDFNLY